MSRALVIGAGGVSSVCVHKMAMNAGIFSDIHLASRTLAKCEAIAESVKARTGVDVATYAIDAEDVPALTALIEAFLDRAQEHAATVMPGFTHLQTAQPVTFGHHCMAYVEMFSRDLSRVRDAVERLDESPLGAAALAGTGFPIDRHMTAKALGFREPTRNSIDSVSDRDFALEFLAAGSICAGHLSRLAAEIVIWCSAPFGFVRLSDIAEKNEEEIQKIQARGSMLTGLPTGFAKLNALTQGMQRTDLIVLAARPGMGKTAFALNIASYLTIHSGYCVAFFSLEMSAPQLGFRIQCAEARVNLQRLREGRLSKEEKKCLFYTTQQMRDARFFIDDQPSISLLEMRARALQLKQAQKGLDAIFVDYLQIMGSRQKYENRTQEVGAYSRGLKALAKELDVPVIALSQLSRRTEQRGAEKEPQLSDLRESGAIEQDADLVIFLSRPEHYDKDTPDKNVCEVIVAKQRNGPTGRFSLGWSGETTRFSDLAQVPEGSGP